MSKQLPQLLKALTNNGSIASHCTGYGAGEWTPATKHRPWPRRPEQSLMHHRPFHGACKGDNMQWQKIRTKCPFFEG